VTSRFFDRQRDYFTDRYRFDLRSHGRSEKVLHGTPCPEQTRDLHDLFGALDLRDMVLVGWSSGAFKRLGVLAAVRRRPGGRDRGDRRVPVPAQASGLDARLLRSQHGLL
jgi:pimeloyl-ACP methyl ester carboxylesterase